MFWNKKKKEENHSKSCASHQCKYYGDLRILSNYKRKDCDCDGYHSFEELYEHRIRLYIQLAKSVIAVNSVWCSTKHSDGSTFGDWFVLGINKERGEQITYHLPARFWNEVCEFSEVLEFAPCYDGHTSDAVLYRLMEI